MLRFVIENKIKDLEIIEIEKSSYAICEIGTLMCIDVPEFSLDKLVPPFHIVYSGINLI
jgi:hypothetical protein